VLVIQDYPGKQRYGAVAWASVLSPERGIRPILAESENWAEALQPRTNSLVTNHLTEASLSLQRTGRALLANSSGPAEQETMFSIGALLLRSFYAAKVDETVAQSIAQSTLRGEIWLHAWRFSYGPGLVFKTSAAV
jgi:hypothetical protein